MVESNTLLNCRFRDSVVSTNCTRTFSPPGRLSLFGLWHQCLLSQPPQPYSNNTSCHKPSLCKYSLSLGWQYSHCFINWGSFSLNNIRRYNNIPLYIKMKDSSKQWSLYDHCAVYSTPQASQSFPQSEWHRLTLLSTLVSSLLTKEKTKAHSPPGLGVFCIVECNYYSLLCRV